MKQGSYSVNGGDRYRTALCEKSGIFIEKGFAKNSICRHAFAGCVLCETAFLAFVQKDAGAFCAGVVFGDKDCLQLTIGGTKKSPHIAVGNNVHIRAGDFPRCIFGIRQSHKDTSVLFYSTL